MSDSRAWPPAASTEAAFAELATLRDRVRALAGIPDVDAREALLAVGAEIEQVEQRVRHLLGIQPMRVRASAPVPVVGERRRPGVGEKTGAWLAGQLPAMRRNRGHL